MKFAERQRAACHFKFVDRDVVKGGGMAFVSQFLQHCERSLSIANGDLQDRLDRHRLDPPEEFFVVPCGGTAHRRGAGCRPDTIQHGANRRVVDEPAIGVI